MEHSQAQEATGPEHEPEPSAETSPHDAPRIYVASLSDYNAGILHGTWLSADLDVDELHEGITKMLADSPTTRRYGDVAEEWAIHDYEGFGPVALGEYEALENLSLLGNGIVAHGQAFAAWWDNQDHNHTDTASLIEQFEEQYQGEFDSLADYGQQLLDDWGIDLAELPGVPDSLRPHLMIDADGWVRDMRYGGEITTASSPNGFYVFLTS